MVDDAQRALGYVTRRDARAGNGRCSDVMRAFPATATSDEHLRILLSRMYQHNTSWLPVVDTEGAYLGEVTQDSIANYLSSGRSRGSAPVIQHPQEAMRAAA